WKNDKDEWTTSFTILTMPAEGVVAKVHDRMPILVPRGIYTAWLSRDLSDAESAKALLKEQRVGELECWDVSTRVNDVHNDDETLCQPAEDKQGTLLLP